MQIQEITQTYLSPLIEETEPEPFEYRESKPRLGYYRALLSRDNPNLDQIIEYYKEWVTYEEYLIFRKENIYTLKNEYKAVKAAKRGNDVYAYKLNKRLRHLDNLPQIEFFNYKDRNKRQKTRALFITFTYRRDLTLDRQWEIVGGDYNRAITEIKRKYGKVDVLCCWESHKDGYPYIHCVLRAR